MTFGVGMKQKAIDVSTVSDPLEARLMPVARSDGSQLSVPCSDVSLSNLFVAALIGYV